jgi:phosphatidylglycerol lysyltransferase
VDASDRAWEPETGRGHRRWRHPALRLDVPAAWVVGHVRRLWPLLVLAGVALASADALARVHPRAVGEALREIDAAWIGLAGLATLANVALMGAYDVLAFAGTRASRRDRWRFGAIAFAWSNFLTLGPLAGPAIRLWLYRPFVDDLAVVSRGIVTVGVAFVSGLAGWTAAVVLVPASATGGWALPAALALAAGTAAVWAASRLLVRAGWWPSDRARAPAALLLGLVGWTDWALAAAVFGLSLEAAGAPGGAAAVLRSFFIGQAIGLASLVPGGFGTADAFWIRTLPLPASATAAALIAYRGVYYVVPWAAASLSLLAIAGRRGLRHAWVARRVMAALVALGGAVMLASVASPTLHDRARVLRDLVPLPLVEIGNIGAAAAGLLLLVLARGLARGYLVALRATMLLLALAGAGALVKGLDWEEAAIMALLAAAAWSQSSLFTRRSRGTWLERRDVAVAAGALIAFVLFGAFAHRITAVALQRWWRVGYAAESSRFVRTAAVLAIGVAATALYVVLRVPVRFARPPDERIERALALHARYGGGTAALTVANGDKEICFLDDRGFYLYRVAGPFLIVFADPVVATPSDRSAIVDAVLARADETDRRPVFYQISVDWMPPLHDRGFAFFKLGEEALVPLDRVGLEGHAGKLYRQILRRGERDGLCFEVLEPDAVARRLTELREISQAWLDSKGTAERQFSIGFFDEPYLRRYPCAVVRTAGGRLLAFANLLASPGRRELSIDLMRYHPDAPRGTMDYLLVSIMLHGRQGGYAWFNLGMAPLSNVGGAPAAHRRERLARLLFRHGEPWYNFRGLRAYKEKFDPEWVPRYLAYQRGWEWASALAHVGALVAGGWRRVLFEV